jgi:hypothetical protein
MAEIVGFTNPDALEQGRRYFLRLSLSREPIPLFTQVRLVAFTACPGVVVVQDARGQPLRCSREALFGPGSATLP